MADLFMQRYGLLECLLVSLARCVSAGVADAAGLDGLRDRVYPLGCQAVAASRSSAHLEHEVEHI